MGTPHHYAIASPERMFQSSNNFLKQKKILKRNDRNELILSQSEALRMNQGHLFFLKQTLAIFILYTRYIKIAQTHDELYRNIRIFLIAPKMIRYILWRKYEYFLF